MKKCKNYNIIFVPIIYLFFLFMTLIYFDITYTEYYLTLMTGLFLTLLVVGIHIVQNKFSIMDPFSVFSFISISSLLLLPLINLYTGNVTKYGFFVYGSCLETTILFVLSFFACYIAYTVKGKAKITSIYRDVSDSSKKKIAKVSLLLWSIFFLINIYYFINRGFSLQYLLTLGLAEQIGDIQESPYMFLTYFKFSLVGSFMYYYVFGTNRITKILIYLLTVCIYIVLGGRAGLIIVIFAPIIYKLKSKNKKIPLFKTTIFTTFLLVLFAIIQTVRGDLRNGMGIQRFSEMRFWDMFEPFEAELSSFKLLYKVIETIPDLHPHLYGHQMFLYTFTMFIPRFVWENKPEPDIYNVIQASLGNQAVANGNAYGYLGEYYVEFGVVGCIVLSYFLGMFLRKLNSYRKYGGSKSNAIVIFSILFPASLQIVIRGYMPSNFSMILFLLLPYFIIKFCKIDYV